MALEHSVWRLGGSGVETPTRGVSKPNQCQPTQVEECTCVLYLSAIDCSVRGCTCWIFLIKSLSSLCESQYWREQTIQVSLLHWGTWRRFPDAWLTRRGSGLKTRFFQSWPKWVALRARKCTSPHFPLILHLWTLLWWENKGILLKSCSSIVAQKYWCGFFGFYGVFVSFFKISGSDFTATSHRFCTRLQFTCNVFYYSKHY